jgi:hypothetical protein
MGVAKSRRYRPKRRTRRVPGISSRAGRTGLTGRHRRKGPWGLVCFRPVGPASSAWHEMPGHVAPRRRRLQGQFCSRASGRCVSWAWLRAGLTGRKGARGGFPGFHPGLVELALQAAIAGRGRGALCVSGLQGQLHQPGMKCQVTWPRGVFACRGSSVHVCFHSLTVAVRSAVLADVAKTALRR